MNKNAKKESNTEEFALKISIIKSHTKNVLYLGMHVYIM